MSDLGKQIQNIHGAERFLVKCEVQSIDVPIDSLVESLPEVILIVGISAIRYMMKMLIF